MFCEQCGKKVDEKWNVCPNCGAQIYSEKIEANNRTKEKGNTVKKSRLKKVWLWILIVICGIFVISVVGGMGEDEAKSKKNQEVVDLRNIGGFEGWEENGFKEKVRTVVTVYLPLVNTDINNYAILADGKPIRVLQENEAPVSEWEWLQNVDEYGDETEYVSYEATLEYLGQKEDDELPVFIISDVEG